VNLRRKGISFQEHARTTTCTSIQDIFLSRKIVLFDQGFKQHFTTSLRTTEMESCT